MCKVTGLGFLFWMCLAHFCVDVQFQSDFVAKHKSRRNVSPFVPWYYVMASHAATHALAVAAAVLVLIGGAELQLAMVLAAGEFAAHFVVDTLKCEGVTGIHADQFLHVFCKAMWAFYVFGG